jgi:non-specific serine/threonine protein kinase
MGVVYLAMDPRLKRLVAIKGLPAVHSEDPVWRAKLAREAEILGRMNHPHIALIYERLDVEGQGSYLIMEYVEGRSIREMLAQGPLAVQDSLRIAAHVASALESAHNRGIVHRDLKPENVQVTHDLQAKVLDFGLATPLSSALQSVDTEASTQSGQPSGMSQAGRIVGTHGYMSPEQARGRPIDRRTDVFAFGCLLYECMSGQAAFPGQTQADRMAAVLGDPPKWQALPAETPQSILDLLGHCLEKDPFDRLRDLADARWTLEMALGKRSTPTPRPAPSAPHNLPAQLVTFIGRESAIDRLRRTLSQGRLVSLVGSAGSGKTSLAIRLAHSLLHDCTGGIWFVDLSATVDPAAVADAIMATMRVPAREGRSAIEVVGETIGERESLLVLDCCEHVLAGAGAAIDALLRTCPGLRVLGTTREVIGLQGEQVYFVPSLSLPGDVATAADEDLLASEAVRLFIDRARLVRASYAPRGPPLAAIARICQRLDGIPLAIELAAARIKVLSPQQIEERLDDRFRLLTGGSASAGSRHRTLRAAMDWSYRLLSDEDRVSLHTLRVFGGGWSIEAACAVLRGDEVQVLDLLTRPVDKTFVVADAPPEPDGIAASRFRLLESIREYLQDRYRDPAEFRNLSGLGFDWTGVCEAHFEHFERAAGEALRGLDGPHEAHWRRVVVQDRDNFLIAQRHSLWYHPSSRGIAMTRTLSEIWRQVFKASASPHHDRQWSE